MKLDVEVVSCRVSKGDLKLGLGLKLEVNVGSIVELNVGQNSKIRIEN